MHAPLSRPQGVPGVSHQTQEIQPWQEDYHRHVQVLQRFIHFEPIHTAGIVLFPFCIYSRCCFRVGTGTYRYLLAYYLAFLLTLKTPEFIVFHSTPNLQYYIFFK